MSETPQEPPQPEGGTTPSEGQPASGLDGLDPQIGGLLAYALFGWVGGLIMFFTQKHPEVRFHGAQSVLTSIAVFVLYVAFGIVTSAVGIGFGLWAVFSMLSTLLGLAVLALWILLCIKGYNLEHFRLPVIGDLAEKWAAQ